MLRKLYSVSAVVVLILPTFCFGDVIDGPANIRNSPNGKIIMTIDDGINVPVINRKGDWYYLNLGINVAEKYVDGNVVVKGAELIDPYRIGDKVIGKSVNPFKLTISDKPRKGIVFGRIKAVTYKSNIKTAPVKNHKIISSLG